MGDKRLDTLEEITDRIREMLSTMQFGSITLVVQNGKVIQLEKNEKLRLR
ncbi:YezD family protein [Kroppenstedtia pulmonis]